MQFHTQLWNFYCAHIHTKYNILLLYIKPTIAKISILDVERLYITAYKEQKSMLPNVQEQQ